MTRRIALIVSVDPMRREFLERIFESAGMAPVPYPSPGAHVLDLEGTEPQVLVVDLAESADVCLEAALLAADQYPGLRVVTIGRREFLETEGHFAGRKNVAMCDRIEELVA